MEALQNIDQNIIPDKEETQEDEDEIEIEKEKNLEPMDDPFTRKPTLPSWLLDVDKQLETFKQNMSEYKKEYDTLTNKLSIFTEKQKQVKRDYIMNKYFKHQLEQEREAKRVHFYDLPKYTLIEIAKYSSKDYAPEIFKLIRVNSHFYHKLNDVSVWTLVVKDYFGKHFIDANEKNVIIFEEEQKKVLTKLEKRLSQASTNSNKPTIPKHPFTNTNNKSPKKPETQNNIRKGEFYWQTIFLNLHARLRLTRSTFKTLYDSKFPKNNSFSLLNTDINKSLCFVIEIFSTVGSYEYNEGLRILDLIKEMVMDQKSLLALIRLCSNDNGVIKINSLTVILILLGYFRDLKKNFLEFTSLTLIQRLETIDKEFNITIFVLNISDFDFCIIPDVAGYRLFFKDIIGRLGSKAQVKFENSFPAKIPLGQDHMKWKGAYLTTRGQVSQHFRLTLKLDIQEETIVGFLEYFKKDKEVDEEKKVVEKIKGKLNRKIIMNRIECMRVPNAMKSFRGSIGKIIITEGSNNEEEYELGFDFALSIKGEGWYSCLHGCSQLGKIFFCYQKSSH